MRKRLAVLALLSAGPLGACGALLGSNTDEIEPPVRGPGGGSNGEAGPDSPDADATDGSIGLVDGGADAVADVVEAGRTVKYVFVTSESFSGNFGNRAGADDICTYLAKQANSALFGSSTFKAYLAGNGAAAAARITDRVYVRMDGKPVFSPGPQTNKTPSDLVVFDEKSNNLSGAGNKFVWTGHAANVAAADRTCLDWASGAGDKYGGFGDMHTTANWDESTGATAPCNATYRLYCFEN